jgi:restriction system protein
MPNVFPTPTPIMVTNLVFQGMAQSLPMIYKDLPLYGSLLWLLLLFVLFAIFYRLFIYWWLSKTGIFDIDNMTGSEFEERLAILFENLGYTVERTGKIGDAGADMVIQKNGIRTAVQAKCYKTGKVHPDAIQQVYTVKNMYNCTEALAVSNRNFTAEAWKLARSNNVKVWGRNYLIKVLNTEKELKKFTSP